MKHSRFVNIVLLSALILFFSCSCGGAAMSLREAQHVLAQADSLWHEGKMYGADEGDSATLAQAYEAFRHFPFSCGEGRGEVAYHYGRLLRAKDNPVEAMQVFIDATHSHTKDYHILGRVYSNIGSICHLAGEFQLSYDMFERSADMFLQNGDTLSYYYALNDMAFELAEQGEKEKTITITNKIYEYCKNQNVLLKTLETQSIAYKKMHQYDSAIYYAHLLLKYNDEPIGYLVCAQAYSYLEQKDSAVFYAQKVLENTSQLDEINNALYILTNADETKVIEDIRRIAAYRSDVQKLLEIRQGKLSQAVQLLEQDLNRKPDLRWLFALVGIVLFAGSCTILYYIWHKRNVHSRLIHDIGTKQKQKTQLEDNIIAMHTEISQLSEQQHKTHQQLLSNIEATCSTLRNSKDVLSELGWKDYTQMCTIINRLFNNLANTLQKQNLSDREIRLCILVLIGGYSDKQMADILYYSYKTIRSTKRHIALKLRTTSADLRTFLIEKVIG